MTDHDELREEVDFDLSMLAHGVPIQLVGRRGMFQGPGWSHPESNPLRDVQDMIRFASGEEPGP